MEELGLHSLANINIELTNRCNKSCWMCGRRKIEKDTPKLALKYGNMKFDLIEKIAVQLPPNAVVQLHNNGEALLYPRFGDAVRLFEKQITNIVTNGKLLLDKMDEIVDNLDTMAVSVFEKDDESEEQFAVLEKFLEMKGQRRPLTILRINGNVDTRRYEKLGLQFARRALHSPMGSYNYVKAQTIVPEIGICLDFVHHLAIDRKGRVSICVRFDPEGMGVIGDANTQTLNDMWNGEKRMKWLARHREGRRDLVPLCSGCEFWGVPTRISE